MKKKSKPGYRQLHLMLPEWLMENIVKRAEEVGQTPTAEIRRALVEAFGKKEISDEVRTR